MINQDFLIVRLIRKGDIKAFEQLFRNYYLPLCRYAQCIVGTREEAEEIIADLFYTLWKDRENLNVFLSMKNYLYAATRNGCIEHIRHLRRKEEHLKSIQQTTTIGSATNPEEEAESKELQVLLENCLSKMPDRCRRVFHMHRMEGMKYHEIATHLTISIKTVEADISKALKILRKEVESYYK